MAWSSRDKYDAWRVILFVPCVCAAAWGSSAAWSVVALTPLTTLVALMSINLIAARIAHHPAPDYKMIYTGITIYITSMLLVLLFRRASLADNTVSLVLFTASMAVAAIYHFVRERLSANRDSAGRTQ